MITPVHTLLTTQVRCRSRRTSQPRSCRPKGTARDRPAYRPLLSLAAGLSRGGFADIAITAAADADEEAEADEAAEEEQSAQHTAHYDAYQCAGAEAATAAVVAGRTHTARHHRSTVDDYVGACQLCHEHAVHSIVSNVTIEVRSGTAVVHYAGAQCVHGDGGSRLCLGLQQPASCTAASAANGSECAAEPLDAVVAEVGHVCGECGAELSGEGGEGVEDGEGGTAVAVCEGL